MEWTPITEHSVADAARAAGIEAPARFVEVTGSTNGDLLDLAASGAPAWTVVVTGLQTAGRGRLGRTWDAPAGSSLLASVLLRPAVEPGVAPLFGLAAAVSVAEACRSVAGLEVRCKWPNDLLVGDRKLGGILVEAVSVGGELRHVVVGLGLNVAQAPEDFPPELRPIATSVRMEGGAADPGPILSAYLAALRARPDPRAVVDEYRARSATVGREVEATTTAGRLVRGTAVGIGASGELLVRTAAGTVPVAFGEVEHLR